MMNYYSIIKFMVLSAIVDGECTWNYSDFSKWPGECTFSDDPQRPQQSPVDIAMDNVTRDLSLHVTNLTSNRRTLSHEAVMDDSDGRILFMLKEDGSHDLSFEFKQTRYDLDHIHTHWGSTEHKWNGDKADGSIHLVFAGSSPIGGLGKMLDTDRLAVIEINVQFVAAWVDGVINDFPRCPNVKVTESTSNCARKKPDHSHVIASEHTDSISNMKRNLFEVLGWNVSNFGKVVHYVGSLTTPPCGGPVEWFVQTEPVKVLDLAGDWLGCMDIANQFPREDSSEPCGNYRPTQPVKSNTKFQSVHLALKKCDTNWFIDQCQ
eukprot:GHVH01008155.1.p1 GENE.GHVH01008155.1~~GHVH01008155.1.p1  ORF type:complete len:320 (+),score=43.67 GHVH01008155.1:905-1864(+)